MLKATQIEMRLQKMLAEKAKSYGIAIVVGIDVTDKNSELSKKSKSQKIRKLTSSSSLSAFAISGSPVKGPNWQTWEQRSSCPPE